MGVQRQQLIVGASGYAWETLTVDFTRPHRRLVELKRAGRLRVRLQGEIPAQGVLRLRSRRRVISERSISDPVATYENLLPGEYGVSVGVGSVHRSPAVVEAGVVEIVEGQEAQLTLSIPLVEPVEKGSVTGRVFVPEEWGLKRPRLRIKRLSAPMPGVSMHLSAQAEEMITPPEEAGWYEFELRDLAAGKYRFTLSEIGLLQEVEVAPGEATKILLKAEPPLAILVTVEDEGTGETVPEITTVVWMFDDPRRNSGAQFTRVEQDPETSGFELRVPSQKIRVLIGSDTHTSEKLCFVPIHGQEIAIQVARRTPVVIELRDDEHLIPWPVGAHLMVHRTDGESRWIRKVVEGGWLRLGIPSAGMYRMDIPKISGYRRHASLNIEVASGEPQTIVVDLVPE